MEGKGTIDKLFETAATNAGVLTARQLLAVADDGFDELVEEVAELVGATPKPHGLAKLPTQSLKSIWVQ